MSSEAFHVTLRSTDGFDGFHERKLTIQPGSRITIGRASRNPQKPGLMTALDNAFIDSPVISREHAALTMRPHPPAVYIADNGSMHGTLVNGERLEAHRATKLSNGDLLQFGADVTRDRDHFLARKYTFESTPPDTSFAHGFTVPDADSSEDEDVEVDAMSSPPPPYPRYGSQTNPVTIHDSQEARREIIDLEEEVTIVGPEPATTNVVEPSLSNDEPRAFEDVTRLDEHPAATDFSSVLEENGSVYSSGNDDNSIWPLVDDHDSMNEVDPIVDDDYNSDHQSIDYNDDSDLASRMDESESESELSAEDDEDGGEVKVDELEIDVKTEDALCRMKLKSMLNHQSNDDNDDSDLASRLDETDSESELSAEDDEEDKVDEEKHNVGTEDAVCHMRSKSMLNHQEQMATPQPETSPLGSAIEPPATLSTPAVEATAPEPESSTLGIPSPTFEANNFSTTPFSFGLPRDMFPKSTPWGSASEYVSPYMPRESNIKPFPDDWTTPLYPLPSYAASPFSNHTENESIPFNYQAHPQSSNHVEPYPPQGQILAATNSAQTPPSADLASQPVRRTKVSIPEIVEDVPQQPPTPTSVSGGLKRKAEVLDEEVAEAVVDSALVLDSTANLASVTEVASTPVLAPAERPKKRLRAAFGGVAKTVAGLLLPGTAIAVGVLTQLPHEFWTS